MQSLALRAAALVLLPSAFALGAVGPVAAASPTPSAEPGTLGANVTSSVTANESPIITVTNRGSVPETFSLSLPDGWGPSGSLTLAPGETNHFTLTQWGDAGDATVTARATTSAPGPDQAVLRFPAVHLQQSRPVDWSRYLPGLLTVLTLAAAVALVARRVRPWELRVRRA